jgi:APA family basic amino acid/polyamine antiporter
MASSQDSLLRVVGTVGLAAGIVNITVGGGIFRLPASVAASLGAAAPVAYLVCAAAMGLIVACVADAGRRVPLTGGAYAYVGVALGPYAAFLTGGLLVLVGAFATAAVATVYAASVGLLVPALGGSGGAAVVLLATFGFWAVVNFRGVSLAAGLNTAATVAKLLPLLLVAVGGLFAVDPANLRVEAWPTAGDVARTSLLLIFAFAGIETALVPSGEVRDPARTVPRAIALAMAGITVLYLALQVSVQGILGDALPGAAVPLADAADRAFGPWARAVLLAGAAVSMFGYLGGMVLSMSRMLFALARDGYLPSALANLHPTHRTPQLAVVATAIVPMALALTGTFEPLAVLANASVLALYLSSVVASWQLGRRDGDAGARVAVPVLAALVIAWLFTGMTRTEWLAFGTCLALLSIVYGVARRRAVTPV